MHLQMASWPVPIAIYQETDIQLAGYSLHNMIFEPALYVCKDDFNLLGDRFTSYYSVELVERQIAGQQKCEPEEHQKLV